MMLKMLNAGVVMLDAALSSLKTHHDAEDAECWRGNVGCCQQGRNISALRRHVAATDNRRLRPSRHLNGLRTREINL